MIEDREILKEYIQDLFEKAFKKDIDVIVEDYTVCFFFKKLNGAHMEYDIGTMRFYMDFKDFEETPYFKYSIEPRLRTFSRLIEGYMKLLELS